MTLDLSVILYIEYIRATLKGSLGLIIRVIHLMCQKIQYLILIFLFLKHFSVFCDHSFLCIFFTLVMAGNYESLIIQCLHFNRSFLFSLYASTFLSSTYFCLSFPTLSLSQVLFFFLTIFLW